MQLCPMLFDRLSRAQDFVRPWRDELIKDQGEMVKDTDDGAVVLAAARTAAGQGRDVLHT